MKYIALGYMVLIVVAIALPLFGYWLQGCYILVIALHGDTAFRLYGIQKAMGLTK